MKFKITGKSLLELREKYKLGSSGFYNNTWWLNEDFAKEKPPAGNYEIDFENKLTNLTYKQQKKKLKEDFDFPHPAVIAEAVLSHYKETGKKLLEDWYSRTSSVDSGGHRVHVGGFGDGGLGVGNDWDDFCFGNLGVGSSRKLGKNLKVETLESFDLLSVEVKIRGVVYKLVKK